MNWAALPPTLRCVCTGHMLQGWGTFLLEIVVLRCRAGLPLGSLRGGWLLVLSADLVVGRDWGLCFLEVTGVMRKYP